MSKTRKKLATWGWMFFDFASQPFHTLLMTFIFAPYFTSSVADNPTDGQAIWGFTAAAAGVIIAILAPVFGAIADTTGPRKPWIFVFSIFYVLGVFYLWNAVPGIGNVMPILLAFGVALIAVEFTTTFSNAMLPDLVPPEEVGQISGSGWGFGYVGGLLVLFAVLFLFVADESGLTRLGTPPIFGLDPSMREGTRAVGPITAIWYVVFMLPFFFWVPDVKHTKRVSGAVGRALNDLWKTVRTLPERRNLLNYLLASMFYRDALIGGIFAFGGIFASSVLGWSINQIGMFGILAAFTGAIGAWVGGRADRIFGPKYVVYISIFLLLGVSLVCYFTSREAVLGMPVAADSGLPDLVFYVCGAVIGATGGSLQAASRTILVHLAEPERMTEAFGLYALTGKATSFLTPFMIGVMTTWTGDKHAGIFLPIIFLFLIGIGFLMCVKIPQHSEPKHASS